MAATMRSLRIGGREFHWGVRTYVMGIVNVTPDSFSGDGVTDLETAVSQARQMEQDGADLVDIGGGATRPETWGGPGLSSAGGLRSEEHTSELPAPCNIVLRLFL